MEKLLIQIAVEAIKLIIKLIFKVIKKQFQKWCNNRKNKK